MRAFEEAASRGLLTIGTAGYDGGAMATLCSLDYCWVVPSDSVHRIQEAQDALVLALWTVRCSWPSTDGRGEGAMTEHVPRRTSREEVVFERIEAFRRRKPRLADPAVTLAHGAGGKASAALFETVFLPAFANAALLAQGDAAILSLPAGTGWPSAPTPTWSIHCGSRVDRSAGWPSTGRSTTWP